jgi:hypothetical protein
MQVTQVGCDFQGCTAVAIIGTSVIGKDLSGNNVPGENKPAEGWVHGKKDYCPAHAEEAKKEWVPFKGPVLGTPGFQSLKTSRIVYQATMPTSPEAHEGNSSVEAV